MGRYLERFSPPKVWNFTPETVWDPDELLEWLVGGGEDALALLEIHNLLHSAGAWSAPTKFLLNTVQHPQEERCSGFENMPTGTMAKPETQPSTVSVLPIIEIMEAEVNSFSKEEASKREQENQRQPVLQQSSHKNRRKAWDRNYPIPSLNKLWARLKYFGHQPGEQSLNAGIETGIRG